MTKEHYVMEGKRKVLLIAAILLSVLLLSFPVFAVVNYDPARLEYYAPPSDVFYGSSWSVGNSAGLSNVDYRWISNTAWVNTADVCVLAGTWDNVGCAGDAFNITCSEQVNGLNGTAGQYLMVGGGGACNPCAGGCLFSPTISWSWSVASVAPICSFTATPTSGSSPLDVSFTDTSANAPLSWDWMIKSNTSSETTHSTLQNAFATLYTTGYHDVNFTATNSGGSCNLFVPNSLVVSPPVTTTLTLDVVDAVTHSTISGASVGLENTTSLAWTNGTAATGSYTFSTSDGTLALPLYVGQTVTLAASAYGYNSGVSTITIPYSGYSTSIALMPVAAVNATGTFWLTVKVVKNEDGTPLNSAIVQVLSGGNSYQQYTGDDGYTTFQNITSSTSFSVTAFHQAYAAQTKVLPVTANFMNVSFSLVRMGATPVTTPKTPVPTGTPAPIITDPSTGKPYVDPQGNPVSGDEANAFAAFGKLSAALGTFFDIGIGIIMIWLLWVLVYEITGGKVIEKLIRRGRR
jgi:PKD repeat protein